MCFFVGKQENMEDDLIKVLNLLKLRAIHIPFVKNKTKKKDENLIYDEEYLKYLFQEDYNRLF
jgi:hypothetical protein